MAVSFVAVGALAASAGTGGGATSLTVTAPTLSADDLTNVTIGTPLLTLQAVAGIASLANVTIDAAAAAAGDGTFRWVGW